MSDLIGNILTRGKGEMPEPNPLAERIELLRLRAAVIRARRALRSGDRATAQRELGGYLGKGKNADTPDPAAVYEAYRSLVMDPTNSGSLTILRMDFVYDFQADALEAGQAGKPFFRMVSPEECEERHTQSGARGTRSPEEALALLVEHYQRAPGTLRNFISDERKRRKANGEPVPPLPSLFT